MVEQFRANLLKPLDKFDDVRFSKEKENEMRKLWAESSSYEPENPPCGSLGIVLAFPVIPRT
jgi:hypothetical protein